MTRTLHLGVDTIIGTGDPSDAIALIPLISDWQVPQQCVWTLTGEPCESTLRRLYVLREPVQGCKVVGVCEDHHRRFSGEVTP